MTDGRYYLSELFGVAFGIKSPVFIPYTIDLDRFLYDKSIKYDTKSDAQQSPYLSFSDVRLKQEQEVQATSWMGTPIVYPFTLKGGSYKKFNTSGELEEVKMADFIMPAATLVEFSRDKIITKTPVTGSKGSVKEFYSFDDWKIYIRGICLNDSARKTAKTAVEQKEQILQWEQICNSIDVVGSLFFEKNILAITIKRIRFMQLEGKPDVIPFELECESDERLELVL